MVIGKEENKNKAVNVLMLRVTDVARRLCLLLHMSTVIIILRLCFRCGLTELRQYRNSRSCAPLCAGVFLRRHTDEPRGTKRCNGRQCFCPTLVKQIFPEFPILSTRRTSGGVKAGQGWRHPITYGTLATENLFWVLLLPPPPASAYRPT